MSKEARFLASAWTDQLLCDTWLLYGKMGLNYFMSQDQTEITKTNHFMRQIYREKLCKERVGM